jgi:hypothetical protein
MFKCDIYMNLEFICCEDPSTLTYPFYMQNIVFEKMLFLNCVLFYAKEVAWQDSFNAANTKLKQ